MNNLEKVYEFIKNFISKYNYPPSVREICHGLNFTSTSSAVYYLKKLEENNLISRNTYKNRAIKLNKSQDNQTNGAHIPIIGKISAGMPVLANEDKLGEIIISDNLFKGENLFILQVKGESMINAGIFNGDYLIVNKQNMANNGEIIVAMIDSEATVKRFYKENNIFRLQPENSFMTPIYASEVEIIGKVVGLLRHM